MKAILSLLLFIILLIAGCQKEKDSTEPREVEIFLPGDQENGLMWAIKSLSASEQAAWAAGGFARRDIYDGSRFFEITGKTVNDFNSRRESFFVTEIPLSIGKYSIFPEPNDNGDGLLGGSYSRVLADGDVLGAFYEVEKDKDNWIEVLTVDTVAKIARGRFSVHFLVSPNFADRGFPPRVAFENGVFDLKFID